MYNLYDEIENSNDNNFGNNNKYNSKFDAITSPIKNVEPLQCSLLDITNNLIGNSIRTRILKKKKNKHNHKKNKPPNVEDSRNLHEGKDVCVYPITIAMTTCR